MKLKTSTNKNRYKGKKKTVSICIYLLLISLVLFSSACSELEKPKTEPYYAETTPPPKQEFRWSNGKMPKSFDPALAAAPPETDVVRAVYEGLTDTDAKNLEPIPSIALKWKSEDENKIWTFELRRDAKWSNGETVTAEDFVRSWQRLAEMSEGISHPDLTNNIIGMRIKKNEEVTVENSLNTDELNILPKPSVVPNLPIFNDLPTVNLPKVDTKTTEVNQKPNSVSPVEQTPNIENEQAEEKEDKKKPEVEKFGVEAVDKFTLKVTLNRPDKDFPALVAHPMFRPIYSETLFEKDKLNTNIVTNGAFRITSVGQDGVTLDKAENYWNKDAVKLQRVRFVPQESAEKALQAYRAGEIDAVTNAEFEPLALKLLTPYDDFQRTVHSALNFYEFNQKRKPFDDKLVREALAISIERQRLTDDEMDGASKPALGFLPYSEENEAKISQDSVRAQKLLTEAGFPNGENFPIIKLLVNRNNVQQRIANSVAKMWKQNLNIETEIIVEDSEGFETAKKDGDYDIIRRGVVLPTSDETVNMLTIFSPEKSFENSETESQKISESELENKNSEKLNSNIAVSTATPEIKIPQLSANLPAVLVSESDFVEGKLILTEAEAITELPAIPLYFPTSYSLVKPYVQGFEINTLDAPSLKDVSIDNFWQPKKPGKES